jgi:hypothetical protein
MTSIFVTAIYIADQNNIDIPIYIECLKCLSESGCRFCVFVEPRLHVCISQCADLPNIRILPSPPLEEIGIFRHLQSLPFSLPRYRNELTDTVPHFLVQHNKPWFLERAMDELESWEYRNIAWIHWNTIKTRHFCEMKCLSLIQFPDTILTAPGIKPMSCCLEQEFYIHSIYKRFTGNFLFGDKESLRAYCKLVKEALLYYVGYTHILPFDVNIMAFLEEYGQPRWKVQWYPEDANAQFTVPARLYTAPLSMKNGSVIDFPQLDGFHPSSVCFLKQSVDTGVMNGRYINYLLNRRGEYSFINGQSSIHSKNVRCEVIFHEDGTPKYSKFHNITNEASVCLEKNMDQFSAIGLEDVRLYSVNGTTRYIATTLEYSKTGKSRMVIGNYDVSGDKSKDVFGRGTLLVPPNPSSWCEKNWIPFVKKTECGKEEEWFIYEWCPMKIGKLVVRDKETHLEIAIVHETAHLPWFRGFRGSTCFQETERGLLGIVHFSEESHPRCYYHIFVVLEHETGKPIAYSHPFTFFEIGIEYCIGFCMRNQEYGFWVSRWDEKPCFVLKNVNDFSWYNV